MNVRQLSDRDLLGVILTEAAADQLLSAHSTLEESLVHASLEELTATPRIGPRRAHQIKVLAEIAHRLYSTTSRRRTPAIRQPSDVFELCKDLQLQRQEEARVLLLDTKNHIVDILTISLGSHDQAILHPQQVFSAAVRRNCASVVLVHCHPSGDPLPSHEDIKTTERLRSAGELLGVPLLDHVIIGRGEYVSLKERGHF